MIAASIGRAGRSLDSVKLSTAILLSVFVVFSCQSPPDAEESPESVPADRSAGGESPPPELPGSLEHPDPMVRLDALQELASNPDPALAGTLGRLAREAKGKEQAEATRRLAELGTGEARKILSTLPAHSSPGVRRLVCRALGADGSEPAAAELLDALFRYLVDPDPEVRQIAAVGLKNQYRRSGRRVLERTRELLTVSDPVVRLAALSVLAHYSPDLVQSDFERALLEGPEAVSEEAADYLVRVGPSPSLEQSLGPEVPARRWVARVLARSGRTEALESYRKDADPAIRLAANYGQGGDSQVPLVMMIVIDTLRADRLSGYGSPQPTSRHLDRLARRGKTFVEARSHAPWTLASHVAMFTSRYPSSVGVRDMNHALPPTSRPWPRPSGRRDG